MNALAVVLTTFLASGVEAVEALTIVLAAGVTRQWRSTLIGVASAAVVLILAVASLGPALAFLPIEVLRLVVGGLLLAFGLQWLRKAILRASGYKAMHDEEAIFAREAEAARRAGGADRQGMDWYAFTLAFKGVLLEGIEVVFIVLSFGSNSGRMPAAVVGAGAAVVVTVTAGLLLHRPLARVPENTMKLVVGLMLTTFGAFWGGEGVGVDWPGAEAAIVALLVFFATTTMASIWILGRQRDRTAPPEAVVPG